MTYCKILESEFDEFARSRNYIPIVISGTNEKIYSKQYKDLSVRIYSTLEKGATRECGADAIRAVVYSDRFHCNVGGATKTLRTGDTPREIFERVSAKLDSLEIYAERNDMIYALIPFVNMSAHTELPLHIGSIIAILAEATPSKTKNGKDCKRYLFDTNMQVKHTRVRIAFSAMDDNDFSIADEDVGIPLRVLNMTHRMRCNAHGPAVYVNLGDYGFLFNKHDFYTVRADTSQLQQIATRVAQSQLAATPAIDNVPEHAVPKPDIQINPPESTIHIRDTYLRDRYDFDLNPMQGQVWSTNAIQLGSNVIVAAPTASGKTLIAELAIAKAMDNYTPAIYLTPLKALAEEKLADWTTLFPQEKIMMLTGDYDLSERQKRELADADIIILTNEMLNSRCIKFKSEQNAWLKNVSVLIVDEGHLVASPGRGDKLEIALMQFTDLNPRAQVIFLSATLSHLTTIQDWLTTLNGHETALIESSYRPCTLQLHYHPFDDSDGKYNFDAKMDVTSDIVNAHATDKFIVFCQSRKDSRNTAEALSRQGYAAEFHNATLTLDERKEIEKEFKTGNTQMICATPTLAMGVNMPAKRVIIQSIYRGTTAIDPMEIQQCMGRAGRPRYDTEGHAHVILPQSEFNTQKNRIGKIRINSILNNWRDMVFHLNNSIYMGTITNYNSAAVWYERTLAYRFSGKNEDIGEYLQKLINMDMVTNNQGKYSCTKLGRIAAMLYHYPDDVLSWKIAFGNIVYRNAFENDVEIALALVYPTQIAGEPYVSKDEEGDVQEFIVNNKLPEPADVRGKVVYKHAMHNYMALTDTGPTSAVQSIIANVPRTMACLKLIDVYYGWKSRVEWEILEMRFKYGVPREATELVRVPGIGKARAMKLLGRGIKTADDIVKNAPTVAALLGDKVARGIIQYCESKCKTNSWGDLL